VCYIADLGDRHTRIGRRYNEDIHAFRGYSGISAGNYAVGNPADLAAAGTYAGVTWNR